MHFVADLVRDWDAFRSRSRERLECIGIYTSLNRPYRRARCVSAGVTLRNVRKFKPANSSIVSEKHPSDYSGGSPSTLCKTTLPDKTSIYIVVFSTLPDLGG